MPRITSIASAGSGVSKESNTDAGGWANVLAGVPLFTELNHRQLAKVASLGRIRRSHDGGRERPVQDTVIEGDLITPEDGGRGLAPNHSPAFYADDQALADSVRIHANIAIDHLEGELVPAQQPAS